MRKITIGLKDFEIQAELLEHEHIRTCEAIWRALPFDADIEIWKEEVYFEIPVKIQPEKPTIKTTAGDVSYWPDGPAFCVFFGRSQPIGPVETFARIGSGIEKFRKLNTDDHVIVEKSTK